MLALFDITCVAFFLALILTPVVRSLSTRAGWLDHPDSHRKHHTSSIPRVGGLAVALSYVLALAFAFIAPYNDPSVSLRHGMSTALALAPAAGIVLLVGLLDDIWGLKPWQKLIGESVAAVLAYHAGFGIYALHDTPISSWLSLPLTVVWLVGCANALNLIDGMDGLAAGVGVFAALTSLVAALLHGSIELALVTAPLVGALIGFLRYNFNPASIFLGDSGSLFIGFLLGCFGMLWGQKSATAIGMTAPLIALAMPLLDTTLAILRRFLRGQPIFSADRGHVHHRLLDRGWTTRRVALVMYAFCGIAAVVSLLQDVAGNHFHGPILVLFCATAWLGVQHLGYAEFGVTSRLVLRGSFRRMVDAQLRIQQFDRTLQELHNVHDAWETLTSSIADFGFSGIRIQTTSEVLESPGVTTPSAHWQIRVPLISGQYVNLLINPSAPIQPIILSSVPPVLERFFTRVCTPQPAKAAVPERASVLKSGR